MKFLLGIFLLFGCFFAESAFARLPESPSEKSLLYWRYLCRGEPQEEKLKGDWRELTCKTQGWKVRAPASEGQVVEVIGP